MEDLRKKVLHQSSNKTNLEQLGAVNEGPIYAHLKTETQMTVSILGHTRREKV